MTHRMTPSPALPEWVMQGQPAAAYADTIAPSTESNFLP
jgi:hypothetical protein